MGGTVGQPRVGETGPAAPPTARLPQRVRPLQVLLGVGAALLTSAGAAAASSSGGVAVRVLVLGLACGVAAFSLRSARLRLRSSAETLAACAAGLAVSGAALGGPAVAEGWIPPLALAVAFLAVHRASPATATWSLAAWAAGQLGALRALDALPPLLRPSTVLAVAVVGLVVAVLGRPLVGRIVLVTAAPWWAVGVLQGLESAWTGAGVQRWLSAALVVCAAGALLAARLREPLDVMLGPPRLVPVVSGLVTGAAVAGACSSLGVVGLTLTGYVGVLVASAATALLTGWRRGLLLPAALAGGGVTAGLCITQLVGGRQWLALGVLFLLTALPTVLVAGVRRDDRPVAVPAAVLCLAGAVLLTLPDGLLGPQVAATLLTGLFAGAVALGSLLRADSRRASARAAIVCAAAAVALLFAEGDRPALSVHLAAQGAFTLGWATRNPAPRDDGEAPALAAWRVGAALLVGAAWLAASSADLRALEWYSLPAAAGLLVARGSRLVRGRSWPAWGPGLLVAAVPSATMAVVQPDAARAVGVLVTAGVAMVVGARTCVRAPLLVGAGTALALALGLGVRALPGPVAAALVVGVALLVVGTVREGRPVAGFGAHLADLR